MTTKDRINPKSMENQDTIEEILTENLPPLEIAMNSEGDSTIEGFLVVEKHIDEYDDNSFGPFVSLPKTLKGKILPNQFDTIIDNMIQPLVNQSHDIIDKDVENLVTIAKIQLVEIDIGH